MMGILNYGFRLRQGLRFDDCYLQLGRKFVRELSHGFLFNDGYSAFGC